MSRFPRQPGNLRKRIMHRLWERPDWMPFWVTDAAIAVLCVVFHHEPIADQCRRPEHDFCVWCQKPMPHQAAR